jgi:hypothetical protein
MTPDPNRPHIVRPTRKVPLSGMYETVCSCGDVAHDVDPEASSATLEPHREVQRKRNAAGNPEAPCTLSDPSAPATAASTRACAMSSAVGSSGLPTPTPTPVGSSPTGTPTCPTSRTSGGTDHAAGCRWDGIERPDILVAGFPCQPWSAAGVLLLPELAAALDGAA